MGCSNNDGNTSVPPARTLTIENADGEQIVPKDPRVTIAINDARASLMKAGVSEVIVREGGPDGEMSIHPFQGDKAKVNEILPDIAADLKQHGMTAAVGNLMQCGGPKIVRAYADKPAQAR